MEKYQPVDATTNPTLLLNYLKTDDGKRMISEFLLKTDLDSINRCIELVSVNLGCEILKRVKGRVSTEVDPRFSLALL